MLSQIEENRIVSAWVGLGWNSYDIIFFKMKIILCYFSRLWYQLQPSYLTLDIWMIICDEFDIASISRNFSYQVTMPPINCHKYIFKWIEVYRRRIDNGMVLSWKYAGWKWYGKYTGWKWNGIDRRCLSIESSLTTKISTQTQFFYGYTLNITHFKLNMDLY